jgi:DNA-binding transcriptional LysR family regulator
MPMMPPKHAVERTSQRLKLRDLRILMTVVECGTMGKAAKQLAVSQPVVSKTIFDMEHAVGVRLLDRSQRGVAPTAYGRALIKRGIVIFDEMKQGLREIESLSDPATGEVLVAATAPIAAAIVAPALAQLCRQYPRMRFKTVVADSAPLFAELEERNVDFVISRISHRIPDHYTAEVLFHDEVKVVTGLKNPVARRRSIALADLVNEPWILSAPDSYFGGLQAAVFRTSGLEPPPPTITATDYHLRLELLATNRLLTIVPGFSIALPRPHPAVRALPVKLRVAREPVGIVTLKNRSLSSAAQMLLEHVREGTRRLAKKA